MAVQARTKLGKPTGRPSDYKDEYCQMMIDHCSQGLSFESFAGLIGIGKTTLYRWAEENETFRDAKDIAQQKCRLWWEKAGNQGLFMGGKDNPFNASVWVYSMKCRFRDTWTEKKEVELTGAIKSITPEEAQAELDFLKKQLKEEIE